MLGRRWLSLLFLALVAVVWPSRASALTTTNAQTRVGVFEVAAHAVVGAAHARSPGNHRANSFAGRALASGNALAAEGLASNAANAPRLAMQLARPEAESAFTATGALSQEAILGARQIVPPGKLGNPAIPHCFRKFSTQPFQSPSGPFQVHFYMNPSSGETFFGLDFKAIFNGSGWAKIGSVYHVLGMWVEPSHTGLRLVGEESTPAIFEPEMFEVVSSKIPPTWLITSPKPGCLSLEPQAWSAVGFWERFFDGDPDAVAAFREEQAKIVAADP